VRVPATVRWVVLALLGLLIAAGVSIAASSLASQQIGLASEPISAGDALAPRALSGTNRRVKHRRHRHGGSPAKTPTTSAPPVTVAPAPAPEVAEPQPPTAPPVRQPTGSSPSGAEQDHAGGGGGGRPADD
jgi:hypothetical protein